MLPFGEEHPFSRFNKNIYIESGNPKEAIYIFKFDDKGVQVVLKKNRRDPFAIVYELIFEDEYNWKYVNDSFGHLYQGDSIDDILEAIALRLERMKYGQKS